MYGGNADECYVDTRIRMYEKQKVNSSLEIIPDENGTTQAIFPGIHMASMHTTDD